VDHATSNILTNKLQDDLLYRPKTKETRLVYEQFLALLQRHVGDLSTEDLKSAGDEVLALLKSEDLTDKQRRMEIETIVDRLSDEAFNQMVVLGQQMVDYDVVGDEDE
jgi:pre-mRNA-splicing helicase BRR2